MQCSPGGYFSGAGGNGIANRNCRPRPQSVPYPRSGNTVFKGFPSSTICLLPSKFRMLVMELIPELKLLLGLHIPKECLSLSSNPDGNHPKGVSPLSNFGN